MKRKALVLLLSCSTLFAFAANIFVTTHGDDAQDGTSWESSKSSIQAAIDAASAGDTVFIAEGVYNQSIKVKDGVHILGGYDPSTGKRDQETYPTILDGTGLGKALINQGSAFKVPTYCDGLTLQNAAHSSNGGAAVLKANGVLNHCTITNCVTTGSGGAVHNSKGTIANCLIELCEAEGAGGAVHNIGGIVENTIIRGCKGNYASIRNESDGIVRNCLLHNNEPSGSSWPNSGGIYNPSGVVYNNTLVCN